MKRSLISRNVRILRLLAAVSLSALAACSSAQKNAAPPAATTPPASSQATAPKKARAEAPKPGTLSCRQGTDQRQAKVEAKGEGCQVEYTKFGQSKIVASSAKGVQHCEDALAHIRKNLTSSGFTCQ